MVRVEPPAMPPAKAEPAPSRPEPATRQPERVEGHVTIQKVRAAWESIVMKAESEKQSLRGELRRAMPDAVEGNALVVKVPNAYSADVLRDNAKLIQKAIQEALGVSMQVNFQTGGAAPARGKGGGSTRTAASVHAAQPQPVAEDPDELFSYLNERIK
jgi:hypothetical protein